MQFDWKGKVRVVIGEMNRAQEFDFWAEVNAIPEDTERMERMRILNDALTTRAVKRLYVCQDGQWELVTKAVKLEVEGNEFILAPTLTSDLFAQFPAGLAKRMVVHADRENKFLTERADDFLAEAPTTDAPTSESPS